MTAIDDMVETRIEFPDAAVICTAPDGTQEWHQVRREGIGGSDVAAILGFVPKYESPLSVFLEKRGELPKRFRSAFLEEAAEFGKAMEPVIREQWAKRTGHTYRLSPGTLVRPDTPWMRVNLDGVAIEDGGRYGVLECKNRSEYQLGDWEEGIPDPVAVQAMWGMAVTGFSFAHVAAVIGGNKLRVWRMGRDEQAIGDLVELMGEFWHNTQAGIRPPIDDSEATSEILRLIHGVDPDATTRAPRDVVHKLLERDRDLKARKKEIEDEIRGVKNRLHDLAGPAVTVLPDGEATEDALYTLKANGPFSPKKFSEEHPVEAAECTHPMPGLDRQMVARRYPELYERYRARVVRVPSTKTKKKGSPQ